MNIYKKLQVVQEKLKAPKSQRNNFGGYNYRNVEDIMTAIKPLLEETNTTIILSDEVVTIGSRYYVKATALFIDIDEQTEIKPITATAYARECETKKGMDESQITGSSSSYARKYALNGLLAIDDTKDADFNGRTQKEESKITKDQVETIKELIEKTDTDIEKFCNAYGVTKYADMTESNAKSAIKILNGKLKKEK